MTGRHLLFIQHSLEGGGAERVTLTLLSELVRRGHTCTLFLFKGKGEFRNQVPEGVRLKEALDEHQRPAPEFIQGISATP